MAYVGKYFLDHIWQGISHWIMVLHIDGLVQERRNSSALAVLALTHQYMPFLQSRSKYIKLA